MSLYEKMDLRSGQIGKKFRKRGRELRPQIFNRGRKKAKPSTCRKRDYKAGSERLGFSTVVCGWRELGDGGGAPPIIMEGKRTPISVDLNARGPPVGEGSERDGAGNVQPPHHKL